MRRSASIPGSPSSRSARAAFARTHQARSERQCSSGSRASAAPSAPSDFAAWARTGHASESSGVDQRRQAGGLPDPAERACGGDPHLHRVAVQQGGERGCAARVVGEAEGASEAGVELDLAAARRDAGEDIRDRRGPCSRVRRIVSTAQGAPSRSMIRSGGSSAGDQGPDQHLGGVRGGGAGEPGAGDEAHVGVGVAQQRDDLLDDRRDAGSRQQQRGAGARGRAAGVERPRSASGAARTPPSARPIAAIARR